MIRNNEFTIDVILISIAIIYAFGITQIDIRPLPTNEIGPAVFPWILFTLLIALCVTKVLVQWPRQKVEHARDRASSTYDGKVVAAVVVLALYVPAIRWIGFLWSTPLFLGGLTLLYGVRRFPVVLVVGFGAAFVLRTIFGRFFGLVLP